jgi:hypothetical protein
MQRGGKGDFMLEISGFFQAGPAGFNQPFKKWLDSTDYR